jgi:hypothetical protein
VIERRLPGSDDWTEDERLAEHQFDAMNTGCPPRHEGVLTSIGVTDDGAVASLGAGGVLVRQADGAWAQRPILDAAVALPPAD